MTDLTETVIRAECASCGGERNCVEHGQFKESGSDDYFGWSKIWRILQCRGCDYVFVLSIYTDSENYEHGYDSHGNETLEYNETKQYWPALNSRPKPNWMLDPSFARLANRKLQRPLRELYKALDADLILLAGIGVRTVFDIASEILGVDVDLTFSKKLDSLVDANHINIIDKGRLETLVNAGSAAAHRGWRPGQEDINHLMDILEHFIFGAFVQPDRLKKLDETTALVKAKVPPRNKKSDAKPSEPGEP